MKKQLRCSRKINPVSTSILSGKDFWQDLRDDYDFTGSYYSVRRFARKLGKDRRPDRKGGRKTKQQPEAQAQG